MDSLRKVFVFAVYAAKLAFVFCVLFALQANAQFVRSPRQSLYIINSMSDIEVKLSLADKKMPLILRISSKSAKEGICYMTNFLEFSPEELLEIAALYNNFVDDFPFSNKDLVLTPKSFYLGECEKVNTALGDKALLIKNLKKIM